jgi:hypothetical protein
MGSHAPLDGMAIHVRTATGVPSNVRRLAVVASGASYASRDAREFVVSGHISRPVRSAPPDVRRELPAMKEPTWDGRAYSQNDTSTAFTNSDGSVLYLQHSTPKLDEWLQQKCYRRGLNGGVPALAFCHENSTALPPVVWLDEPALSIALEEMGYELAIASFDIPEHATPEGAQKLRTRVAKEHAELLRSSDPEMVSMLLGEASWMTSRDVQAIARGIHLGLGDVAARVQEVVTSSGLDEISVY